MHSEVIAGRYALCDPIGTGGSGTVWRAFDLERRTYCAAKLLRQRDAGDLLRFAREQSVRLTDPHIVSPYAWAADDAMVLIASELIDGGSVHTLIGDYGPLADSTIVAILEQVLKALVVVHGAHLVHRDVKPGNLLLRATGAGPLQVLLTDFGLTISRRDARLTTIGHVVGTPGYLPPELLAGRMSPHARHDLYAVGRLALTLLGGQERDGGGLDLAGAAAADFEDPVLRDTVRAMLMPDPADRPATAADVLGRLADAARSGRPTNRDGDAIVVVDQLPALPAGWDHSAGPADVRSADSPTVIVAVGDSVEGAAAQALPPAATLQLPTTTERASSPAGPGLVGPARFRLPPGRRRTMVLSAVATLAVAGAVIGGVVGAGSPGSPGGSGTTRGGPSASTAPIRTTPAAPVGTSATSGSPSVAQPGTVGPDGVPPTTVTSAPGVVVGQGCSWQQEGDRLATSTGVIVCTLAGGRYTWA